jgi:hypothetical protein
MTSTTTQAGACARDWVLGTANPRAMPRTDQIVEQVFIAAILPKQLIAPRRQRTVGRIHQTAPELSVAKLRRPSKQHFKNFRASLSLQCKGQG